MGLRGAHGHPDPLAAPDPGPMSARLPFVLLLVALLTACGGAAPGTTIPGTDPGPLPDGPSESPASATAVFLCPGGSCDTPFAPVPTATPPALRFALPTMGAEPVSGWRPPLYPVPWAVGPYDHFYFLRPIAADQVNWPVADYRFGGVFFRPDVVHTGVDIPAAEGVEVIAAGAGTVEWAGWGLFSGAVRNTDDPYGLAVAIRHDFGHLGQPLYTIYAHMQQVDVAVGQWVEAGQMLGLVGQTGFTTGPHLHFEVRWGANDFGHTYNPELWVVPPQGWGVLAGRMMGTNGGLLNRHDLLVRSQTTGEVQVVKSYSGGDINRDPHYMENIVLSDLPAGWYTLTTDFYGAARTFDIQIAPGQVTYFNFYGYNGFELATPPVPGMEALTPGP